MKSASRKHVVQIKRIYDAPGTDDGVRVLVDRLWPRGIAKEKARVDEWLKELAPSTKLRQWFGHDPKRWDEFQRRHQLELDLQPEAVKTLRDLSRKKSVTLIYAAKDEDHNNAVSLRNYLMDGKRRHASVHG